MERQWDTISSHDPSAIFEPTSLAFDAQMRPRPHRRVPDPRDLHGIHKSFMFCDADDRLFFLDCLRKTPMEESVAAHTQVPMTNHLHLLPTAKRRRGVSAVMKRLGQRRVQ